MQAEMGGKNAAIIDESADLAKAAQLVASGAMRFAGQKCTATSRAIVHRSVLDAFLDELESAIDRLPIGDPIDASTAIGPVINQSAYERQSELLNSPPFEIVKLRARPSSDGWFIPPTVFRDVDQMSPLAQDEIFGPILSVLVASDLEEAIQIANQTRFGLSATLLTQDLAKAITYMDRIDAGLVRVNGDTTGVDPHAPFGGVKASSTGVREQGPAAKEFYTEIRTIQISP
jgi:aldehyde dehydrogenase (NAD+)